MSSFEPLARRRWALFSKSSFLLELLVASTLFVWLVATRVGPPVHPDTARDLLQAVACSIGNTELCQQGPHTSFAGLQGALWPRFLMVGNELRIPLPAMQALTLAFIAIGAGTTGAAVKRYTDEKLSSMTASIVFVGLSLLTIEYPVFWNPSLLPLPLAVFVWALLEHSREGRTAPALIASVALALCVDLHIVCLAFAPLLLMTTVASARHHVFALVLVFAGFFFTVFAVSPMTWATNFLALDGAYGDAPLMLGPLSCAALGLALRSRWQNLAPARRAAWLVFLMAAWLAIPAIIGRFEPRYAAPSVPALSIALGWAPLRLRKGARRALAGGAAYWLATLPGSHGWHRLALDSCLECIARLAPAVERHGIGGQSVFFQLEGLSMDELASLVAFSRPADSTPERLAVIRAERSHLPSPIPETWTLVELSNGDIGVLRKLTSPFLRRDAIRACYAATKPTGGPECKDAFHQRDETRLLYPPFPDLAMHFDPNKLASLGDYRGELTLEIDTGGPGSAHLLDLIDPDQNWRIEAVEGISYEGELPGRRVLVHANSGKGSVSLVRHFEAGTVALHWPPLIIETLEEETELRSLYQRSLSLRPTSSRTTESESPPRLRSPNSD